METLHQKQQLWRAFVKVMPPNNCTEEKARKDRDTKKIQRNLLNCNMKTLLLQAGSEMFDKLLRASKLVSQFGALRETISQEDSKGCLVKIQVHKTCLLCPFQITTKSSTNRAVSTAQAINTANRVFVTNTQVNAANIDNLSDAVICAFLAIQPNNPQLAHEDLQQIHLDELEEMDLRWQMTMLTIRARRSFENTALRNPRLQEQGKYKKDCAVETSTSNSFGVLMVLLKSVMAWVSKRNCFLPNVQGNLQMDLQDQGVIDSGCSRYMTGNMPYLTDYEEIDEGYVTFGGNPKGGKITGKEAGNTACYVHNRVLVVKPYTKTPYELFHVRTPTLSFMRPFGCPVTILNTIDHLGKFDGKADEGFFVGYSLNSKAFRVFNSRTRIVEENVHIRFSESTPNVVGIKASDNAGQAKKEIEPVKNYILLPLWPTDPPFSHDPKISQDDGFKPSSDDGKKVDEDSRKDSECNDQEKEDNVNNTNNVNAACTNKVNVVGGKTSIELPFDPNMPTLEDYSIFESLRNDEDDGVEAHMNNLDTTFQVSPNPTTRIHKDHHLDQEEPKKVIHALKDPSWIKAMQEELLQIKLQEVWTLVDLLYGKRAIGTKWVFRKKKDERGIVIRNKAKLVAQGYTQEEEIDYDEVFAPVIEEEMYVNHQDLKTHTFLIEYTRLKKHFMDYIKLLEPGTGYIKNGQNRAWEWKEHEKSKPKAYSLCSWCGGPFNGGNCRQCTNVSFSDEFVCNPDPISNDKTLDFSYPLSQPKTSSFDQFHCFGCGDPLEDDVCFQLCTCKWCGYGLREGFCWFCALRDGNSSIDAPNSNSFNDPPNVFTHPPQPQNESYSCELCGNNAHYGYDCLLREPLVYEREPCYNQNFGDNYYPQNSSSFPQQYLCCENFGGPHESFQCQPINQNYFEPNSNYSGFDQPSQYPIDQSPPQEMSIQDMELQKQQYLEEMQSIKLWQPKQAANLSTYTTEPSRHFNSFYDDDGYEESIIPLNEIVYQIPPSIAITLVLPIMEPEDSLIIGDENLSTIPEKESDKVIKSSVEDLVPIPSKAVTFSNPLFNSNDDFTSSDDESLPEEDVLKENFKIYSNPLFEFDDEYISSDVNLLFNEVLEDIESEHSYVSKLDEPDLLVTPLSKLNEDECFDPGGDFVLEEIEAYLTSDFIPPGIDDDDFDLEGDILLLEKLLNDDPSAPLPLKEHNFEELKVIKSDVSTDFKDDYYDSEGDIIYLESLLIKDTIPNLPPDVFLDRDPRSLEDEPDKYYLKNIVKFFDPGIWEKKFSRTYMKLPFEDRHYLSLTYVI
ncbi:putative reverse transcriptase, RNA-dependent DNA polymerase [Tanacetum coccineum]